jgi:hypothetical protein
MNSLIFKSVKNTWQKSLTILDNHYVNLSLVIVLILYCSQIFGNINSIISNLYQYNFVKLLLLLTIAYVGPKDTNIAVLLAISYVISLRNKKNSLIENFEMSDKDKFNELSLNIVGFPNSPKIKDYNATIKEDDAIKVINILTIYKKRLNQKHFGFDMTKQKYIDTYNYFMDCLIYLIVNSSRLLPYTIILVAEYFGKQSMLINFNFDTKKETKASLDNKFMDTNSYQPLNNFMKLNDKYANQKQNYGIKNKNTVDAKILLGLISNNQDKEYFGLDLTNEKNLILYNYSFESLVYIMANQESFTTSEYGLAIKIFGKQSKLINFRMMVSMPIK